MKSRWLRHLYRAPVGGPGLLVLFHYAGGAASAFRHWPAFVGARAETVAVQLPGREGRLFGHSMGASLAYHIARTAIESRAFALAVLGVSARRAPHIPPYERDLRTIDDTRVLDGLRAFGELPAEFLAEPELTSSLIQRTRADYSIAAACHQSAPPLLHERMVVPVLAIGGAEDATVTAPHLLSWQAHTRGPFRLHMLGGQHFFIRDRQNVERLVNALFASAQMVTQRI
jgi:surfactin synthase thioesterase subunit